MRRPAIEAAAPRNDPPSGATAVASRETTALRRLAQASVVLAAAWVVLAIGTPLLGVTVFAGTDLMMARAPWSYLVPAGFLPQNLYVGDTVDGFLPATHEFLQRLRSGDFAQWWPYNSGGQQLASVPNTAQLSPLSLPYLLLPLQLAPGYVKVLELVVAIGGTYLFLRRLNIATAAAVLGGVVFASSGFMVAWTNWPQTRVAAFIPALFWAVERLLQRRRAGDVALVAVVVAAMLLGGFPAVTGYALVSAAVYCLVRTLAANDRRLVDRAAFIALAGAGVLVGFGLAAMQLIPFLQELAAVSTGNRAQNSGSHSPVEALILTIAADAFGGANPNEQVRWYGPTDPVEEMSYVGAAALVLLVIGVVALRRPGLPKGVRGYFVVAAIICVVLIFVGGPLLTTLQQLPLFSDNRMGRVRSMLGFFVAVLAAIGFDALLRAPAERVWSRLRRSAWKLTSAVFLACSAGAGAVVVFLARRVSYAGGHPDAFEVAIVRAAMWGAAALTAVLVATFARGTARRLALLVIPVLVVAQSLTMVHSFWPRVPTEQFYPETPTHAFLAANLGADRLVTAATMMTGTEAVYGLRTTGGRGFISENYDDLLRAACRACYVSPTYVSGPEDPRAFDAEILDRLGTKYRVTDPAAPVPGVEEVVGGGAERVQLVPGQAVEFELPTGGLRAVGVIGAGATAPAGPWGRLSVVIRDSAGNVLVETERRLFEDADGGPLLAAVPDEATADAAGVTITLVDDGPLAVRGRSGVPALVLIRPVADGLRVVAVGGATVYERLTALPRIRWASSSVFVPDEGEAAELLRSGRAPEVVLAASGPEPSGQPASLDVVEDGGDVVEVEVDADGGGFLVVADAVQDRWTARVDGAPAELRHADIGVVAVWVPAGRHVVRLEYELPAGGLGYVASAVAGAVVVALVLVDRWSHRRRRRGPVPATS